VLTRFTLNGKNVAIDVDPLRRAVDLLREDFRMTGTKEGCGTGECGACTILVNGESRLSCLMSAFQLEGSDIVTIEGMSLDGVMHPLQEAFIAHGAIQCGFCTPGMVMSAADLLRRNPKPTREEIREGLSGNLCRCTGYQKIVDAVEAAALEIERDKDR
jgi:aerobic carbon-monoxide dehydrogenase small subunit